MAQVNNVSVDKYTATNVMEAIIMDVPRGDAVMTEAVLAEPKNTSPFTTPPNTDGTKPAAVSAFPPPRPSATNSPNETDGDAGKGLGKGLGKGKGNGNGKGYGKGRGGRFGGPPAQPALRLCYRCRRPGHEVKNCPERWWGADQGPQAKRQKPEQAVQNRAEPKNPKAARHIHIHIHGAEWE